MLIYIVQILFQFCILFFSFLQKGSVVTISWPKVGSVDEVQIKASQYLMETAHSLRVHLKTYLQGVKSKANPNPLPVPKPNVVNLWVAKTFPHWQSIILTVLKKHFEVSN